MVAGNSGDMPLRGNDNNEDLSMREAHQSAADHLRQDAFNPSEMVQKLETAAERFDPKVVETSMAYLNNLMKKYFEPDHTGTSVMDRLKNGAPELYTDVAARYSTELVEPFKQTGDQINQLLRKLQA